VRVPHYLCRLDQIALDLIVANSGPARKGFSAAMRSGVAQRQLALLAINYSYPIEIHPFLTGVGMRIPPPEVNDEYINRRDGWAKALGEIKAEFPDAAWFEREMEQKEFR
jgi:hypothetical protein